MPTLSEEDFRKAVSDPKVPDALQLTRNLYCAIMARRGKCIDCQSCLPVLEEIYNFQSKKPLSRLQWRLPNVAGGSASVWLGSPKTMGQRVDEFGCPRDPNPFDELQQSLHEI